MKVCPINSKTLRQLWSIVEQTQTNTLLGLSDPDLVSELLMQLNTEQDLTKEEMNSVNTYLFSKTMLIRDLAIARLA